MGSPLHHHHDGGDMLDGHRHQPDYRHPYGFNDERHHHHHSGGHLRVGYGYGPGYGYGYGRRGYGPGYGYGYGDFGTRGEHEFGARVLLGVVSCGVSELFRLCFCRDFGRYPIPDVDAAGNPIDPNTGNPIDPNTGNLIAPPGQPMGQAYPPAQGPANNGMQQAYVVPPQATATAPAYTVTPQAIATADKPKYGYTR